MPSGPKRLNWAPRADKDLRDIWLHYAAEASSDVANKIVEMIKNAAERLQSHPLAGRPRDSLRPGLRSVLAHPYVVFYRVQEDTIQIARVLHEHRNLPAALSTKD